MPAPMPKALVAEVTPEVTASPALSLMARPGDGSIRARRVAILVADGVDGPALKAIAADLFAAGAGPRFVGSTLGAVHSTDGELEVDTTVEATPSVLFDSVIVPDSQDAVQRLAADGRIVEFVKDQYRHCKPIMAAGAAAGLLTLAGIPDALPSGEPDPGLVLGAASASSLLAFKAALAKHRHFERETDPPLV